MTVRAGGPAKRSARPAPDLSLGREPMVTKRALVSVARPHRPTHSASRHHRWQRALPGRKTAYFDPIDRRDRAPLSNRTRRFPGSSHLRCRALPREGRSHLLRCVRTTGWTKFMLKAWSMCCAKAINGPSPCARLWTRKANSFAWTTANRLANGPRFSHLTTT